MSRGRQSLEERIEQGGRAWKAIVTLSEGDSLLSGDESQFDELVAGRSPVQDPEKVFRVLQGISTELQKLVAGIENPRGFLPALRGQLTRIGENQDLPQEVRGAIAKLAGSTLAEIARMYEGVDHDPNEPEESVATRVVKDIKRVSWVPLKDEEVLGGIHVEEISLEEMRWAREIIPQLDMLIPGSGFKGGAARVVLKLLALQEMDPLNPNIDTLIETIRAELPLADVDLVVSENATGASELADRLEIGPIDMETIPDFSRAGLVDHFGRRDLSANQALITQDKLFYNREALNALRDDPGKAKSAVSSMPGLWGREAFWVNGREYMAANTLYRLAKSVAEGKAEHFVSPRYNLDSIQIEKYWLTMARKWVGRPDRAIVFAKAYSCAVQMGATETKTPTEFLEELLAKYPDFKFGQQTLMQFTQLMVQKYIVFIEKILRRRFKLKPEGVNEIFASTDKTNVTVQPNIEGVDEDQLAEIEKVFERIGGPSSTESERQMPEIVEQMFATKRAEKQEALSEIQVKLDNLATREPRRDDRLYLKRSREIDYVYEGYAYFICIPNDLKVPLASLEVGYWMDDDNVVIGWKIKEGTPLEKAGNDTIINLRMYRQPTCPVGAGGGRYRRRW